MLRKAHGSLNIDDDQWKAFLKQLGESLDSLKIADREKRDMLALTAEFQSDIVAKK